MLRALERAAKRRPHHLPPKQLSPKLGPSRRRCPCPARRPGGRGAGGGAEGREGRALLAEQSPRHALLKPRADKRSLRGCKKPRAPCSRPVGKVRSPPRAPRPGRMPRLARRTSPTPLRGAPRPARPGATKCPLPGGAPRRPNLSRLPTMGSPTPPAAASGRGQAGGAGARSAAAPARPPASHHPPAARQRRGRHLENRAYFSRACPSEGTAEPLPLANMVCREEDAEPPRRRRRRRYRSGCSRAAPSLPAPSPALARTLARALLAALPSLPPRRWLRALSSCQSVSPGRGPIALELLPRRLGLECRCRRRRRSPAGPAARWLARAPARPAPPAPPSAPPAPLPPPPPLVYLELNRTWLPRRGIEAGVNVQRLIGASANLRAGAGPGRPGRDALSAPGRGSPR